MHLDFASLLGAMIGLRSPTKTKRPVRSRSRKLLGEQLETRYALSTILADGTILPDPTPPPTDPAQISTNPSAPPSDPTNLDPPPPPMDPPPSDPPPTSPPPSTNLAPQISMFTYQIIDGWCTLIGQVVDDVDPTGLTVNLDGVLSVSVVVDDNDTFRYVFELAPDFSGTIYASTTDLGGLESNIASLTLI